MEIKVKRIAYRDTYTIGKMYIDGCYFCDTLEDKVRDLHKEKKILGETAIPQGKYKVTLTISPKLGRVLPLINNVPYFDGIRIHSGNTEKDTQGCILVGENKEVGKVLNSRVTETKLVNLMLDRHEDMTITIE